jgi:hypothetical protein
MYNTTGAFRVGIEQPSAYVSGTGLRGEIEVYSFGPGAANRSAQNEKAQLR